MVREYDERFGEYVYAAEMFNTQSMILYSADQKLIYHKMIENKLKLVETEG